MKVPDRLQHLRRDRRGIPVPWINRWTTFGNGDLDPARMTIESDPWARMPGLYEREEPGDLPDFTKQHMGRQRESTLRGLCQVCGRPVPWSRRFLVVADIAAQIVDVAGVGRRAVLTEPWLDEACAVFALRQCPALIRRTRAAELTMLSITSQRQVEVTVSTGWVEGPLEAESKRIQPAMWAKIIVRDLDLQVVDR